MEWITIVGFIVFGLILIILEVIFVPGTTIVGIGGFVCLTYGIYISFIKFGNNTGFLVLAASAALSIGVLVYSLKSKAWEKFSLKNTMSSRVNENMSPQLSIGEEGNTMSSLKPVGKAIFQDFEVEVRTMGEFLMENQKVKIIKIDHSKIFVEPIT